MRRLATACLFLACKVEEVGRASYKWHLSVNMIQSFSKRCVSVQANVRTNDLLNTVLFVAAPAASTSPDTQAAQRQQHDLQPDGLILVGQEYYAMKQILIIDEQILLRTVNFDIVVEHPHRYVLNFSKLLGVTHSLVQMALVLLNDSLVYTNACLVFEPADIAAASLEAAFEIVGAPSHMISTNWAALGVHQQHVESASLALLDMVDSQEDAE